MKTVLVFIGLACSFLCHAQPTFYAHLDNEKVYKGAFFKIEYQLSDAKGQAFTPPDFKDFRIAAGPSRSFQTSIVNGKMNRFEGYAYTLQAIAEGDYVIPPARIRVDGQVIQSNALRIKVLPPLKEEDLLKGGAPDGKDFFLVAELNRDTAYAGQQILLDYRIFTKKNIDQIDFKHMPELSDFQWQSMLLLNEVADQVEIGGETYSTKLIKRFALFPKRPGNYNLDAAQVQIMMKKPGGRHFFFDNYDMKLLHTNEQSLVVLPLPDDEPEAYSGLVGNYTMETSAGNRRLTTDDAISVRVRIKGNGDAHRMSIAPIPASEGLDAYDPKIISRNNDQNQKTSDHFALIEYLFTASKPGDYVVRPQFTYFDPDSTAFITLSATPYRFTVTQGSGQPSAAIDTTVHYQLAPGTARRPVPPLFRRTGWQIGWFVLLAIALLLATLKYLKMRNAGLEPPKSNHERAVEALEALKTSDEGEVAHRIEEIFGIYFRNRLQLEESEWSTERLQSAMEKANYPSETIEEVTEFLKRCAFAAYSGIQKERHLDWVEDALELIKRVKESE